MGNRQGFDIKSIPWVVGLILNTCFGDGALDVFSAASIDCGFTGSSFLNMYLL